VAGGSDRFGNVYVVGYFLGTTDFDPGPGVTSRSAAVRDYFVLKLDQNLVFSRLDHFESSDDISYYNFDLYEDGSYNIMIDALGQFDINLGLGVEMVGNTIGNVFLFNVNPNGIVTSYYRHNYTQGYGRFGPSRFQKKPNGHMIIVGQYWQNDGEIPVDFDQGPNTANVISGYCRSNVILELDENLDFVNVLLFGDPEYDGHHTGPAHFEDITRVFFNKSGEMYILGFFKDTTDLDPGPLVNLYGSNFNVSTQQHESSVFVIKLNSDYSANWIKLYEGTGGISIRDILCSDNGLFYIVGNIAWNIDFDLSPGNVINNAYAGNTAYVIYDEEFNYKQHFSWGNGTGSNALSLILDKDKNLYTVGKTRGPVDFDPGPANTNVQTHSNQTSNSPYYDMYMVKYHTCDPSAANLTSTACDSFVSPSGKYNYTVSGVYKDTVYNVNGCDSIITIDLTILPKSSSTTTIISCVDYLSPSGNVYTLSGIYHDDTLTSVNGCDSILIIDLSIPVFNITTNLNATTISSNQPGVNYQWYDCLLNEDILNETNQSYTATANGEYAVILENQGCTDTSTCVKITGVGIGELSLNSAFELYPNPSTTAVYIQMNENQIIGSFKVYDMDGRLIKEGYSESSKMKLEVAKLEPGVYLIAVEGMGQKRFVCLGK
jgi:hypothetical protein